MAKAKKESEERQKQKVASIQAYYKELAAMAALVKEPGQLSEKKCDESVVAKRTKEHSFGGRLLTVDHEFVSLVTGPTFTKDQKEKLETWEWVRSQEIKRLRHPDDIDGSTVADWIAEDIDKAKKLPFIGFLRTVKRAMPIVPEKGDDFTGGIYDGWIVVVDQAAKQVVCQVAFTAENSDEIKYKEGRFSSESDRARAAAKDDLLKNFEQATNASLKKISNDLRVNLGLFQL
jgi:hypothetical protein